MNVLINATAASEGGALTILNSFLYSKKQSAERFYVLSPIEPEVKSSNIVWIKVTTNGVTTYIFTLFFSYFFYLYFRCEKILSFNNINTVFLCRNKVTYFHNMLICSEPTFKYRLLRFTLKWLNQKESLYIFQTSYVEDEFESRVGFKPMSKVCWPGVLSFNKDDLNQNIDLFDSVDFHCCKYKFVVPVADLSLNHKNFKLAFDIASKVDCIKIIVPAEQDSRYIHKNVIYVGSKNRSEILSLIKGADGVLITSSVETVCLPIFEAISLGKVAYVYRQPYVNGIKKAFDNIHGLVDFSNIDDFQNNLKFVDEFNHEQLVYDFHNGNWNF
ncbi:hypothetical protein [Vibrio sp. PNB22_4_2]